MRRFGLTFISLLVVGLLALGAVVVLADKGGPGHGVDHGVANGLQDDSDGVVAQQSHDDPDPGNEKIAQAIADAFSGEVGAASVDASAVTALHDQGIGFGALFKLYQLAAANGESVQDLVTAAETGGDFEFNFGEKFKALSDTEQEALEAGPKNLGELVSAVDKDGATSKGKGHGNAYGHDKP